MLVRIANREDPNQTALDLGLCCLSRPFWQQLLFKILEHLPCPIIVHFKFITCLLIGLKPYRPRREKTCLRGVANNKGADQPAHPHSLISTFVILFLKSIIT